MDTETSGYGSMGTVVRRVRELLVNILNSFWLLVLPHKGQFDLVLLLSKKPNRIGLLTSLGCMAITFLSTNEFKPDLDIMIM